MPFEADVAALVVEQLRPIIIQKFEELKAEWRRGTDGERPTDRLTIEEVAKKLKVSKRTVTRMVESKRLPEPEGKGKARRWLARDVHIAKEARVNGRAL